MPGIPDADLYHPRFEPWEGRKWDEILAHALDRSLVSRDGLYVSVHDATASLFYCDGDVIECGIYRGDTARMFGDLLQRTHAGKRLYLCDTFEGMPEVNAQLDLHRCGDFSDTSLQGVREFLAASRMLSSCRASFHNPSRPCRPVSAKPAKMGKHKGRRIAPALFYCG